MEPNRHEEACNVDESGKGGQAEEEYDGDEVCHDLEPIFTVIHNPDDHPLIVTKVMVRQYWLPHPVAQRGACSTNCHT